MGQEAAQPPLYYVVSAILIKPIDTSEAKEQIWFNPFARLGDAVSPTNTNAFIHPEFEGWPWEGYVLAAHLLRIGSAVIGLGTLIFIYSSGRLVWPEKPERALLATALIAFLPQFNFLNASISNDPLVVFFCAASLFQLLRMWYGPVSKKRLLLLGVTIGLGMLSKMAGLLMLFYAAGFLAVLSWRQQKAIGPLLRTFGERLLLVGGTALLVGGWLLIRNWQLYGDITATSVFIRLAGGDREFTLGRVLREIPGLWRSFFAVFGWMNVAPPFWLYYLWNGLVVTAVVGVGLALLRAVKGGRQFGSLSINKLVEGLLQPPFLLAVWVFVVYGGLVQFLLKTPAAQGRLMFPALVPLALGLAYGISQWRQRWLMVAAPTLMLAASLFSLSFVIPKAFEKPDLIERSDLPGDVALIERDLGQGVRLVAAAVETETAAVGEWVWLTLYWQNTGVGEEIPILVLELFGQDAALLGKFQSYHGRGRFPASLWPADMIVVDRTPIRVARAPETAIQGRLNVKMEGETNSVDAGFVKLLPDSWPAAAGPALAEIDGMALTSLVVSETAVSPGETIDLAVQWQVQEPPGRNLTTFVHLGEQNSVPLAQGDSPPLRGLYPTQLWEAGEVIDDGYQLLIPEELGDGRYPLYIGFYDPVSGERSVVTVERVAQPNNAYFVGWIEVSR
jgi:4-amino-4-deoxy-L-arabinose transferase-like glycosyltransferase